MAKRSRKKTDNRTRWSASDDAILVQLKSEGLPHEAIAKRLGRTTSGVLQRTVRLRKRGKLAPEKKAGSGARASTSNGKISAVDAHGRIIAAVSEAVAAGNMAPDLATAIILKVGEAVRASA